MSNIEAAHLPHLMAALNAATLVTLLIGLALVRRKQRGAHRAAMLTAISLGAVFLAVYTVYHASAYGGVDRPTQFAGQGILQLVFFGILIVHVAAAVSIAVCVPWTFTCALRGRFDAHRKIARYSLPLWGFVCASGIVVYAMVEHGFAGASP